MIKFGWGLIVLAITMEIWWLMAIIGAVYSSTGGGRGGPIGADFVIHNFMGLGVMVAIAGVIILLIYYFK